MSNLERTSNHAKFNIFRALRLEGHEIRHSNFLAWLLDPTESHGQGGLFLDSFLRGLEEWRPEAGEAATEPEAGWCDGVQVNRELDQLDLRIVLPSLRWVIGVENKLFTSEHSGQLSRYADSMSSGFPNWRVSLLYLTIDAEPPSDVRWRAVSHRQVATLIENGLTGIDPKAPPEVVAFIRHYLDLFDDIYARSERAAQNPRQPEVLATISAAIAEKDGWKVIGSGSVGLVECGPRALFDALPPIGVKRGRDASEWLTLRFQDHGLQGYVGRYWRPTETSDVRLRNAVLRSLIVMGERTGFKYKAGSMDEALAGQTPAFSGDRIQDLRTGQIPEATALRAMIHRELAAVESRLSGIIDAVRKGIDGSTG